MAAFAASIPLPGFDLAALVPARWRRDDAAPRGAAGARGGRAATLGSVAREHASDEPSDEKLMLDFLDGRREAFERLVTRYRVELHQFLFRFLNSSAAADDVFQEAFIQVFQSGHTFDPARRFRPWLFTIAANKARDWHRRHRNRGTLSLDAPVGSDAGSSALVDLLEGDAEVPGEPLERDEQAALVKEVVEELSPALREILLLAYFQRLSYGQIAEILEVPLGTVKSRLHSAVASFAEEWRLREERVRRDRAARRGGSSGAEPRDDSGRSNPPNSFHGSDA